MKSPIRHTAGFTLIELLVVILIVSIVTGVALLSISRNQNKRIESFANELKQVMMLAEEQAMLQPTVLGLSYRKTTFQFESYGRSEDGKKMLWMPFQDSVLNKLIIPSDIQIRIEVQNKRSTAEDEVEDSPPIIFSTNGDVTPFTVYVGKRGEKPSYAIIGEADGSMTTKLLS